MNNNNVVNHVLQTNVHTMFKRQKGNRPINKNHLNRLTLSMKDNYLFSPIPRIEESKRQQCRLYSY